MRAHARSAPPRAATQCDAEVDAPSKLSAASPDPTRPPTVTAIVLDEPEPLDVWHLIAESLIHEGEMQAVPDTDTDGVRPVSDEPKLSP